MLNMWQISISTFPDAHWIIKFSVRHKNNKKTSPNGTIQHVIVDGAVSSSPLIVCNNPFGVNDPFMGKPVVWFAQAETGNCPRVKL